MTETVCQNIDRVSIYLFSQLFCLLFGEKHYSKKASIYQGHHGGYTYQMNTNGVIVLVG